ncbi:MAG: thiamine-binding protein [Betaproteobacteria bacterium]|nr:thiamine-binding protein [Betaproteobacteria bacterium]
MNTISVQVSLYPLRQPHVGPSISRALEVFRARGLEVRLGTMSTVVAGDADAVFDSLKASFQSAAALGDVVMVASISNCCPT